MAFLDFGFFKRLPNAEVEQMIASTRATYDGDAEALFGVISGLGALPPDRALVRGRVGACADSIYELIPVN